MGNIPVGTSPVPIALQNPHRTNITARNESTGGEIIYLSFGAPDGLTSANSGYTISPGEEKTWLYVEDGRNMLQPLSAVCSGAGGVVKYTEMTDSEMVP